MVPQVVPEQPVPVRVHTTAVFELPETVAVNCCLPPDETVAAVGDTCTETEAADSNTTVADADLVVSAEDLAVMVAMDGVGTVAGAV
jgi:hypothetical protein